MVCLTSFVSSAVTIAAGSLGAWIKGSPKFQTWLNRTSRLVFVSLAVKLATSEK